PGTSSGSCRPARAAGCGRNAVMHRSQGLRAVPGLLLGLLLVTVAGGTTFAGSAGDTPDSTRGILGSSRDPSEYPEGIELRATVFSQAAPTEVPTGTFQFRIDGIKVGTPKPIDSRGRATIFLYVLGGGTHWVSGRYSGDSAFMPSHPVPMWQGVRARRV